jgi:hypothetical protein
MTTLQMIIKKAKALKAAAPKKYAKWTDYVKAASATIKPKKKATVGAVKKKAVPKKAAAKKTVKKAAPKKATSIHKDSKSHNVRISVVSGVKNNSVEALYRIKENNKSILNLEQINEKYKIRIKEKNNVKLYRTLIKDNKSFITMLKKENTNLKKYI